MVNYTSDSIFLQGLQKEASPPNVPQTISLTPMSLPCYLLRPNVGLLIEALQVTQ